MNCEGCLNKDECENCGKKMLQSKPFFFHVGEILTLKGRLFKVKSVKPEEIRLKLWRKTTNTVKGSVS